MKKFILASIYIVLSTLVFSSQAQNYPSKPVKLIIPQAAGGATDVFARYVGQKLSLIWNQPVVTENKVGAAGVVGTDLVAKSAPDGYTLLLTYAGSQAVNPSLYPSLPFDTLKDLTPLMQIGTGAMVVTAHASTPYKNFNDVVQAAKSKPGTLGYGTIGSGSMAHLAMTYLGNLLKVDWTHIPYKGGGPLAIDGVAGHVPVTMATYALWAPHFASGKLRPLAVTSNKRMAELPDVPTLQELGIAGFEAQAYWGMLAPAGVPKDIVNRMHAEMTKVLKIPAVQERLTQMGVVVTATSPSDFDRFIRNEVTKWSKVVKDNNIQAGQ